MPEAQQNQDEGQQAQPNTSQSQPQGDTNGAQPEYLTKEEFGKTLKDALTQEGILGEAKEQGMSKQQVQQVLDQQRDQILKELGRKLAGEPDEPQINDLTKELLLNPQETLKVYGDYLRESWREELRAEQAKNYEIAQLGEDIRKRRPDIASSKQAQKTFTKLWQMQDENMTAPERFNAALSEFDHLLEQGGLGSADDRIKKAQTAIDSAGRSLAGGKQETGKSEEQYAQEEQEARVARYRKLRHLDEQ